MHAGSGPYFRGITPSTLGKRYDACMPRILCLGSCRIPSTSSSIETLTVLRETPFSLIRKRFLFSFFWFRIPVSSISQVFLMPMRQNFTQGKWVDASEYAYNLALVFGELFCLP